MCLLILHVLEQELAIMNLIKKVKHEAHTKIWRCNIICSMVYTLSYFMSLQTRFLYESKVVKSSGSTNIYCFCYCVPFSHIQPYLSHSYRYTIM